MLRRPGSTNEPMGRPVAGRDPEEDECQQELANEVEKEKALDRGWWLSGCPGERTWRFFILARPRRLYYPPPKFVLLPRHERHV
jgi:hypothetical protein